VTGGEPSGEVSAPLDCIFCGIVAGRVPSRTVREEDDVLAFRDIRPVAPTHVLVIPKRHIPSLADVGPDDWPVVFRALRLAKEVADTLNLGAGYRLVTNVGPQGGQTVGHLHWHLLAGRPMGWPPG
jgi:histidine triad (HIT) family protein